MNMMYQMYRISELCLGQILAPYEAKYLSQLHIVQKFCFVANMGTLFDPQKLILHRERYWDGSFKLCRWQYDQ